MIFTGEEDEECVATEFEEYAAFCVGHGEELREAGADHLGELLGTDPTMASESFGQAGEARDVDEHRGRVERAPAAFGLIGEPLVDEAREERRQDFEVTLRVRRHHLPHGLSHCPRCKTSSEPGQHGTQDDRTT